MTATVTYSLFDLTGDEIKVRPLTSDVAVDVEFLVDAGENCVTMRFDRDAWDTLIHCVELAFIDAGEGGD